MSWQEWIRTVEIAPALGSADPAAISTQVEALLRCRSRIFHLRVGEDLVGLETARLVAPLLRRYGGVLDVRVDGSPGQHVFERVAEAGGSSVTFQLESVVDAESTIAAARAAGLQAGAAFASSTDPGEVSRRVGSADLVRCPSSALDAQLSTLEALAGYLPPRVAIQVGGAVTHENIRALYESGARVIVVGRTIFKQEDLPRAYRRLVEALA